MAGLNIMLDLAVGCYSDTQGWQDEARDGAPTIVKSLASFPISVFVC